MNIRKELMMDKALINSTFETMCLDFAQHVDQAYWDAEIGLVEMPDYAQNFKIPQALRTYAAFYMQLLNLKHGEELEEVKIAVMVGAHCAGIIRRQELVEAYGLDPLSEGTMILMASLLKRPFDLMAYAKVCTAMIALIFAQVFDSVPPANCIADAIRFPIWIAFLCKELSIDITA